MLLAFVSQDLGLMEISMGPSDGNDCSCPVTRAFTGLEPIARVIADRMR